MCVTIHLITIIQYSISLFLEWKTLSLNHSNGYDTDISLKKAHAVYSTQWCTLMWLANSFKYTYYRYTRFDQTTTLFAHYAAIVCASIALSLFLSLSSLTFPVMMKSLLQINWIYCLFSVRLAFGCLVLTKYSLWSTTAHYAVKFLQKQRQREDEWESRWGKGEVKSKKSGDHSF